MSRNKSIVGPSIWMIIISLLYHGGPEAPGALTELGLKSSYVEPDTWDRAPAIEVLKKRFGFGEELIDQYR